MDDTTLVFARNLHRRFAGQYAVRGLDLELRRGEVLGLLGPNGAGKSTALRMLTGQLEPSAGHIYIKGIDLHHYPRRAKAQLGYLPEQPPLYPDLTVDEYLTYCARLHALKQPRQTIVEAKGRCGLVDVGRRLIGNLSKGYQQRVGIAQAILHRPDVIILDEPTVGLDPRQLHAVRELIRELGREHGVILSSHILSEVQTSCDRVLIMNLGRGVYNAALTADQETGAPHQIRLGLRRPPERKVLLGMAGVHELAAIDDTHWIIQLQTGTDGDAMAEQLAARAAREEWGLFELSPQIRSLEQTFLALTQGREDATGDTP